MTNRGYSILGLLTLGLLISLIVAALVAAGGIYVFSQNNKHPSPLPSSNSTKQRTTSATNLYAVLVPATVASKSAECTQTISYASNGVPGPVQCSNGDLNATDWAALAALEPQVLTLGYGASSSQVQSALCSDVQSNISNPIEETIYQIAVLYYGWNFSSDPSVVISNGTCQNVDD